MSQNEEDDQNPNGPENEFEFYFQFTKPLVLYLPEEDKSIAAAWVEKLEAEPATEQEKRLRLDYLKLLLFVLQRGRLSGIFRKQPPEGPLQPFSQGFNMSDMGNLMIDQDDIRGCGGGDTRAVPYTVEISNDLREFVAAQEIPNFGVQMYYAWSSDDPIHKWSLFDEDKFPQYLLDKIKLLKEIKSDEKTSTKTTCGVKKLCDLSLPDKYVKTKVKSPQEIEKAQGRSYQTYLGLVGRIGGGFKDMCDDDPEKYNRQEQRKEKCQKKSQKKCAVGPSSYSDQIEGAVDEEYDNFLYGLSGNLGNQSRCYPNPVHSPNCESHAKPSCNNQSQPGSRSCSPKSRTDMSTPNWVTPVARPVGKKMRSSPATYPDSYMTEELPMNQCQTQKRSVSPPNRSCLPNRNEVNSSMNNCKYSNQEGQAANFSPYSYPCPNDDESPRRPIPSAPARPGGDRGHKFQCMKQWTTPVDASFRGLAGANRCPSAQNEMMQCYNRQPQAPIMNQKEQEDDWSCDIPDSKRKEKKGRQIGQDCRSETKIPCPRQAPSPCPPPVPQQMQCKSKRQDFQDMCRREQQDLDCTADTDESMGGAYGSTAPNFRQDLSGGANTCNQLWKSQNLGNSTGKSMNCNYPPDFNDGYNSQQLNYPDAGRMDPCAPKKDVCPPVNDVCNRTMGGLYQNSSKMQGGKGGIFAPNTGSGRLCNMADVLEGIKQKTDSHRERMEMGAGGARKMMPNDDVCQRNMQQKPKQYCQPPQQEKCPPQPQCPPQPPCPPQPQCPPQPPCLSFQAKSYAPPAGEGASRNTDMKCGRNAKALMNKQSEQACWLSQQPKKSPPPLCETYNVQKAGRNASMNMMNPCIPDSGPRNFRGTYNYPQGVNRSNMQNEECPETCPDEEEYDKCDSASESADDCPQGSSTSAECLEGWDEDAEALDEVANTPWAQNQTARGCYSSQRQKNRDLNQTPFQSANKRKGRFFCSTPKQPSFGSCEPTIPNYMNSTQSSNRQIEQTCQNFFGLPDASMSSYGQREPNYGAIQRDPYQMDNQGFGNLKQSRGACTRTKDKKKRPVPSLCDDNAQFDSCKQPCEY